jgi:hypothetical protein
MRVMLKAKFPVQKANALAREGKLGSTIQKILTDLNPESVYFTTDNGKRCGYLFVDIPDSSHIPRLAEPWFLAFDAEIDVAPVMNIQDLMNATGFIEEAVQKHY